MTLQKRLEATNFSGMLASVQGSSEVKSCAAIQPPGRPLSALATNGLPDAEGPRFKERGPLRTGLNAQGQLPRIEAGWPGSLSEPTRTSLSPLRRRIVMSLSKKLPA